MKRKTLIKRIIKLIPLATIALSLTFSMPIRLAAMGETEAAMASIILDPLEMQEETPQDDDYIKWMSFDVPLAILEQALYYDISAYQTACPLNWIELIAYSASRNWGSFPKSKPCRYIDEAVKRLRNGENMETLTQNLKLYHYYLETYTAVLGGFVGEYDVEQPNPDNPDEMIYIRKYGLKTFFPLARGYSYTHYDDFGVARTYGYRRRHLGNDLMGSVGTPVIAIEDGYVEALGWNRYGGWRIGIRSRDQKRYYYYAHLRKDHPYVKSLKIGDFVQEGDVIGYLGMTGYSAKENTNNIKIPHLHFGMQIIFDESQKDAVSQIWINTYNLLRLLDKHKIPTVRDGETQEFVRTLKIRSIPID